MFKRLQSFLIFFYYFLSNLFLKYFAAFGMSITILMFISTFFEFDWYHYKRGVDVGAVIGLFLYLAIGVLIHYYVIIGVKRQLSRYLLPFICVYTITCVTETCMCIGLL